VWGCPLGGTSLRRPDANHIREINPRPWIAVLSTGKLGPCRQRLWVRPDVDGSRPLPRHVGAGTDSTSTDRALENV